MTRQERLQRIFVAFKLTGGVGATVSGVRVEEAHLRAIEHMLTSDWAGKLDNWERWLGLEPPE